MAAEWLTEGAQSVLDWLAMRGFVLGGVNAVWTPIQLLLVACAYVVAVLIARRIEPAFEARLRQIKGSPRLLRLLAVLLRQLKGIIFVALLWAAVLVIRAATWPSRSYLLAAIASLVTAWVVISIASRVFRNRLFAN